MKILLISLLRIGDFYMHLKIAEAIKMEMPHCDIHFLTNDIIPSDLEFSYFGMTLHQFKRTTYQKNINTFEVPLFYPLYDFKNQIVALNDLDFDLIIDLTYQRLSGKILSLLKARKKIGIQDWKLEVDEGSNKVTKKISDISDKISTKISKIEWQFLENFHNVQHRQHYIESLKDVLNSRFLDLDINLNLKLKMNSWVKKDSRYIVYQIKTSDRKKNYALQKWISIIERANQISHRHDLEYKHVVLCSKEDYSSYRKIFKSENLVVVNLKGLFEMIDQAELLISLDTVAKHMAVWTQTPTLEISIGSSHPFKTSAYQLGNWILSAEKHCRPCSHSSECIYKSNLCQDSIDENQIVQFITQWMLNNRENFGEYVKEVNKSYLKESIDESGINSEVEC